MQRGGRGRGGGRGRMLEALGIEKGEVLPDSTSTPSDLFPPLVYHPVKTNTEPTENQKYQLSVLKDMEEHFRMSPYYLQLDQKKPAIERYSDRYQALATNKGPLKLHCLHCLPKEIVQVIK